MEILYNFFVYGFIGWIIENIFSYYIHGHFQKEGFLKGPFKPMYAIAMAWMLELYKIVPNIKFLIIISFIIPTTVEYITGFVMRKFFNNDYWDYSKEKFNYEGIICLKFSIIWVILSVIDVKVIHPYFVYKIFDSINGIWPGLSILFILALFMDEILTFIDFRKGRQII
ncbi:putative ABC transporter permease [uncultured Clostridium sp.]|mgnify:FL=1|uniref:putative ABC transporter permease n=1 Tax=uncultured Clostridium sp. TaxID=59620 RepID=UPI0025F238D7|nr:putative ABC transporter permease [uncultured Clostridium sp.]